MSKKNGANKKLLILVGIVVVIVVIGICIFIKMNKEKDNTLTDYDRISKILTTTRKTDIFIVGEQIDFNNKITTKNINEVSKSKISGNGDYTVIIVNDLNDEVELSEDEIELLKDLISKNNYMLIYLGEKYSTTWDDESYGIADIEGNLCYIYYSWDGVPTRNVGVWTETDQEASKDYPLMLGESLLLSIEDYLQ